MLSPGVSAVGGPHSAQDSGQADLHSGHRYHQRVRTMSDYATNAGSPSSNHTSSCLSFTLTYKISV